MNAPDQSTPLDFGKSAMCAALNMTEDELTSAYRAGEIIGPDTVRLREPRWSFSALATEITKRLPRQSADTPPELLSPLPLLRYLEALERAEIAEGMRNSNGL